VFTRQVAAPRASGAALVLLRLGAGRPQRTRPRALGGRVGSPSLVDSACPRAGSRPSAAPRRVRLVPRGIRLLCHGAAWHAILASPVPRGRQLSRPVGHRVLSHGFLVPRSQPPAASLLAWPASHRRDSRCTSPGTSVRSCRLRRHGGHARPASSDRPRLPRHVVPSPRRLASAQASLVCLRRKRGPASTDRRLRRSHLHGPAPQGSVYSYLRPGAPLPKVGKWGPQVLPLRRALRRGLKLRSGGDMRPSSTPSRTARSRGGPPWPPLGGLVLLRLKPCEPLSRSARALAGAFGGPDVLRGPCVRFPGGGAVLAGRFGVPARPARAGPGGVRPRPRRRLPRASLRSGPG